MVTVEQVCALARTLPRAYEVWVYGQRKFRVKQIVFLAISRDETTMGIAFPKDWRPIVVESEPHKFTLPRESDLRFHWIHVRLDAIDRQEMRDLVVDGWKMVVPKYVAAAYDQAQAVPRRISSARTRSGSALSD
jgi:hypothetical protein